MLIAVFVIVFLLEILVPLGLGLYFKEKFGAKWKIWFVGAATFIASQIVHIPMLLGWQRLLIALGVDQIEEPSLLLTAGLVLAVSFMAGLCEEPARWFAYKLLKEEGISSRDALTLGAGHGGVESMFVALTVISSAVSIYMFQSGNLPLGELQQVQVDALQEAANLAWYLPLWGGLERLSAIGLHVSLSVLVWLGVRDRKPLRLLAAIGIHTLFNFVAVFSLQGLSFPVWAVEFLILVVSIAAVMLMIRLLKQHGMMTLYAPEKLDDEEEFSGLFAEQFREAGFAGLTETSEKEVSDSPDSGVSEVSETP